MKIIFLATLLFCVYTAPGESVECIDGKVSTHGGRKIGNQIESECTSPEKYCMRGEIIGTTFNGLYSLDLTAWFCASATTCNEDCADLLDKIINVRIPGAADPDTDNSASAITLTSCKRACCDTKLCNNKTVDEIQTKYTSPATPVTLAATTPPTTTPTTNAPETSTIPSTPQEQTSKKERTDAIVSTLLPPAPDTPAVDTTVKPFVPPAPDTPSVDTTVKPFVPPAPDAPSVDTTDKPVVPPAPDTPAVVETSTNTSNEGNVVVTDKPFKPPASDTTATKEDVNAPDEPSEGDQDADNGPGGRATSLSVPVLFTTLLALFSSCLVWVRT